MKLVPICKATTVAEETHLEEEIEGYYFYDYKNDKHYIMKWVIVNWEGIDEASYEEVQPGTLKFEMRETN